MQNIYVKSFSGTNIEPTWRENPDQIIAHVGSNDLALNKRPEQIEESIISMVTSLVSDTCDVLVSTITLRNDEHHKKVAEVNIIWK